VLQICCIDGPRKASSSQKSNDHFARRADAPLGSPFKIRTAWTWNTTTIDGRHPHLEKVELSPDCVMIDRLAPHVRSALRTRHREPALACPFRARSRHVNIEFVKSISSNNCRACRTADRSEKAQIHCHPWHAVDLFFGLQGESPENGSFPGFGWRLSGILAVHAHRLA